MSGKVPKVETSFAIVEMSEGDAAYQADSMAKVDSVFHAVRGVPKRMMSGVVYIARSSISRCREFGALSTTVIGSIVSYLRLQIVRRRQRFATVEENTSLREQLRAVERTEESAQWTQACEARPAIVPRGIHNPGCLCYMNAALAALASCPRYCEELRNSANEVAVCLNGVIGDLNATDGRSLWHFDASLRRLSKALIEAGSAASPWRITSMEDSVLFLEFMLQQAGLQFDKYDWNGAVNKEVADRLAICRVNPPEGFEDGLVRLEDFGDFSGRFRGQAPTLLPVAPKRLDRSEEPDKSAEARNPVVRIFTLVRRLFSKHVAEIKLNYLCSPPLMANMPLERSGEQIPYCLRSVILHLGETAQSGHYITVVPRPTGSFRNGYPTTWEIHDDSRVSIMEEVDDGFLESLLRNAVCYLYERVDDT